MSISGYGVDFHACGNTLKSFKFDSSTKRRAGIHQGDWSRRLDADGAAKAGLRLYQPASWTGSARRC